MVRDNIFGKFRFVFLVGGLVIGIFSEYFIIYREVVAGGVLAFRGLKFFIIGCTSVRVVGRLGYLRFVIYWIGSIRLDVKVCVKMRSYRLL